MSKVATVAETRLIEGIANQQGITFDEMIQRAGKAIADRVLAQVIHLTSPKITILVGSGNNGSDGIVAGLLVAQAREDIAVRFYLLKERPNDPYLDIAQQAQLFITISSLDLDKRLLRNLIASSDVIIDSLFGIGVNLPLRDEAQRILRVVQQVLRSEVMPTESVTFPVVTPRSLAKPYVIAVDVPSGVNADTGEIDKNTLYADETITFIAYKKGLFLADAVNVSGKIALASLDFPENLPPLKALNTTLVDFPYVTKKLPSRPLNSHKGIFGKVVIVGGSENYYGAIQFAAKGAYKSGAGLVTVATSQTHISALAPQNPETIWIPYNSLELTSVCESADVVLLGCGLGTSSQSAFILEQCLSVKLRTAVIDADALTLLGHQPSWWQKLPHQTILTPHPKEMARLCNLTLEEVVKNRWEIVLEKAQTWNVTVLLKGAHTLIATPQGQRFVLPFKTDALAKAGMGDVLAGMIAGFLAQKTTLVDSAIIGSYIHAYSALLASQSQSTRSILPSDILENIGIALKHFS